MSVFLWLQSFYVKFTSWTWCHNAVNIFDTFFLYIFLFLLPIDFCVIILHCGNAMVCKSMCDINSNHSSFFIVIHFSQWIFPFDVVAIFVKQCFRFISILLCMQPLIRSHFKPFTFNIHQFTIYLYYGAMKKKNPSHLGRSQSIESHAVSPHEMNAHLVKKKTNEPNTNNNP